MIVREYRPGSASASTPPREARIGILLEALSIPWLKEKGPLTIHGDVILAAGSVVATIERCAR